MTHALGTSDWGDWLPRAVETATPRTVAVWYLGCNGLVLKGRDGTTLWIDPYCGVGDPPRLIRMVPVPFDPGDVARADAILATHEHTDHVHGPTQGPMLAGTDATYVAPAGSLARVEREGWAEEYGLSEHRFHEAVPGETLSIGEFDLTVVRTNDPDADDPVGYAIAHETGTVFHGGDTRPGEELVAAGRAFDIDLGVVALGSAGRLVDPATGGPAYKTWYADPDELVRAATQLRLDRLVPTHWDVWKGLTADPTALSAHRRSHDHPRRLAHLEIGDRTEL